MGVFSPIYLANLANNQTYISTGVGSPSVIADGTNDAFIYFGGIGTTLALVLMGLLFAKKKVEREILKFGGAPAIFNINEPIIFGFPLVLNFTYVIPFVLSQAVLFTTTWLSIEVLKWVPPVIVKIPWTTPVLIGGFLATSSWQGIILSGLNYIIACLIWLPFILISNKQAKKRGEELVTINYKDGWKTWVSKIMRKNKQGDK